MSASEDIPARPNISAGQLAQAWGSDPEDGSYYWDEVESAQNWLDRWNELTDSERADVLRAAEWVGEQRWV